MNYSNMIEEKTLKKTFIIATLMSTIIGTFTTGINLYERVGEKRKQNKKDNKQDDKIKELEKRVNDTEKEKNEHQRRAEDLKESMSRGGPMIQREYDRDYARLGPKFAEGDAITQTQLQSQVITLQGTVIGLLENALYTGRLDDVNRLYNASEFAREGSIRALRDQYQRMLQAAPLRRPIGPVRRISSTPTLSNKSVANKSVARSVARSVAKSRGRSDRITEIREDRDDINGHEDAMEERESIALEDTSATHMFDASGPLYCKYAMKIQDTGAPLDMCFSAGGTQACPVCGTRMAIRPGRSWRIDKELVHEKRASGRYEDQRIEERTYFINNRFIVKCHREGAGFACILCFRYRDSDTLCETAPKFVNHVWKKHSVAEYETDPDIEERAVWEERISKRY